MHPDVIDGVPVDPLSQAWIGKLPNELPFPTLTVETLNSSLDNLTVSYRDEEV
jgi:hypothetical protein